MGKKQFQLSVLISDKVHYMGYAEVKIERSLKQETAHSALWIGWDLKLEALKALSAVECH